jgi:phage repressor protein C with HTH and peptisase S24 domain
MINNDGITLISFNPAYPDMVFSAKEVQELPIRICGKVIKAILNF